MRRRSFLGLLGGSLFAPRLGVDAACPSLERDCPACGFGNVSFARFCCECGARMSGVIATPDTSDGMTVQPGRVGWLSLELCGGTITGQARCASVSIDNPIAAPDIPSAYAHNLNMPPPGATASMVYQFTSPLAYTERITTPHVVGGAVIKK